MISLDTLRRWLTAPSEGEHLEFKEAKQQYDTTKLLRYCVALANEGGGYLVLGVADKLPRRVVGTQAFGNLNKTKAYIVEQLHMRVEVHELAHPDGRVLVFEVPSRPTGQPLAHEGAYLMRAGEDLVPMTPDQLKRIFAEGQPEFVDQVALGDCSEEDVAALLDLQSYFDLRERPFPSTRAEAVRTFVSKGFVRQEKGGYAITNLGALLFAKRLEDFSELQRKAVRVIVYDGITKSKVKDGKDRFWNRGYANGFVSLLSYINDQLPASEEIAVLRETTKA